MKSYTFKVAMERDKWPDEPEGAGVWRAWVPILEERGAHAWGDTQEQALENLRNAVALVLRDLIEHGEEIPAELSDGVVVADEPLVTVTR